MGQYVVDPKIARDYSAETPNGRWLVEHHIEYPSGGGAAQRAEWPIPAADVLSLKTAVATSDAAVGTWLAARIPSAWGWGATEAHWFRKACGDVKL